MRLKKIEGYQANLSSSEANSELDLAPFSFERRGCQGFIGPIPPPFFISLLE